MVTTMLQLAFCTDYLCSTTPSEQCLVPALVAQRGQALSTARFARLLESVMHDQNAPVCAAIDIGSNTVHIVVARYTPDSLDILEDQQEMVRIGESVTTTGAISPQKRDCAISVLRQYKALADQHCAQPVLVVATEAIRQATNSDEFLSDVLRETGLEVHLIEGDTEATLTFYGATYVLHHEPHPSPILGVMDLRR